MLRPIMAHSLVIAACVAAFRADQQAPHPEASINAVLAGATVSVDAHKVSLPAAHSPARARVAEGDVPKNAVESLRSTYGSIANASEGERATPSTDPTPTDALGLKAQVTPVPSSTDTLARAPDADFTPADDASVHPNAVSRCAQGVAALGLCEPWGKR